MRILKEHKSIGKTCEILARNNVKFSVVPGHNDDGELTNMAIIYTDPKRDDDMREVFGMAVVTMSHRETADLLTG